jgi:hypothetical protein
LREGWGAELFRCTLCFGRGHASERDTAEQLSLAAGVQKQFFRALQGGPRDELVDAVRAIGTAEQDLEDQLRARYPAAARGRSPGG